MSGIPAQPGVGGVYAVLDACVLIPERLSDMLFDLALQHCFQPLWTVDIEAEFYLHYDIALVGAEIARTRRAQGVVEGTLTALGFEQRTTLVAGAWSQEAVATAAIEGERLDLLAVRFSVARRLGVSAEAFVAASKP